MAEAAVTEPTFPDYPPTVPELLRSGRERFGERECVVTPDARLTYAELDEASARVAAALVGAGANKGSHVGVLFPNGVDWVVAWAAAARIGGVVVPVNTFYQAPELGAFLRHADVEFVLGVDRFLHHDYLARLETVAPELAEAGPGPLVLPSLPSLRRVLLWGPSSRPWADGQWAETLDREPDPVALAVAEGLGAAVVPDDPMLITYTSGSTGDPKGVVQSHGALLRQACNLAALSGLDPDSRIWTPMPLCWVGGFAFSLLRALMVGGCFITQAVFEAGAALRVMQAERVTNVSAWPGVTKSLSEHPDFAATDLSALRSGVSFYDAVAPDRRPRIRVWP